MTDAPPVYNTRDAWAGVAGDLESLRPLASAAIAYGDVRDRHRPEPVVNADDGAR